MSIMTQYTDMEIYSSYQGVSGHVWSQSTKKSMRINKNALCRELKKLGKPTFLYVGVREKFTSHHNNPCLVEVKKWNNGARLLYLPE